jgi:hypothetical protein
MRRRISARLTVVFVTFVFDHLPPPPRRVLEIGCGRAGGLVLELADAGYEVLGVDPDAPEGEWFLRSTFQEARDALAGSEWDAVVAGRVLHHVQPLDEGVDILASLAPLLVVDEFAWDRIDAAAQAWYEVQHRHAPDPYGPADLEQWRRRHPGLHPHAVLLDALRARYDEIALEWVPYFHRWLGTEPAEERRLIDAGELPAIGYRWAGASTSTTRSSAPSR